MYRYQNSDDSKTECYTLLIRRKKKYKNLKLLLTEQVLSISYSILVITYFFYFPMHFPLKTGLEGMWRVKNSMWYLFCGTYRTTRHSWKTFEKYIQFSTVSLKFFFSTHRVSPHSWKAWDIIRSLFIPKQNWYSALECIFKKYFYYKTRQ